VPCGHVRTGHSLLAPFALLLATGSLSLSRVVLRDAGLAAVNAVCEYMTFCHKLADDFRKRGHLVLRIRPCGLFSVKLLKDTKLYPLAANIQEPKQLTSPGLFGRTIKLAT
jgi:hypothetical protein